MFRVIPEEEGIPKISTCPMYSEGDYFGNAQFRGSCIKHQKNFTFLSFLPWYLAGIQWVSPIQTKKQAGHFEMPEKGFHVLKCLLLAEDRFSLIDNMPSRYIKTILLLFYGNLKVHIMNKMSFHKNDNLSKSTHNCAPFNHLTSRNWFANITKGQSGHELSRWLLLGFSMQFFPSRSDNMNVDMGCHWKIIAP